MAASCGLESLSSTQVARRPHLLDEELAAWRHRPLGEVPYLVLDARYEKLRDGGVVSVCRVLDRRRLGPGPGGGRVLGVSCGPSRRPRSTGGTSWRACIDRGLCGVRFVVSDDHAGLRAARRAVGLAPLAAVPVPPRAERHSPRPQRRHPQAHWRRAATDLERLLAAHRAEELDRLVAAYRGTADRLADWLEHNVPEGFAVFTLPEPHWRRLRTANPIERAIQQEIKRRTSKVRVFPNRDALLRLATTVLVEIDEDWAKLIAQSGIDLGEVEAYGAALKP